MAKYDLLTLLKLDASDFLKNLDKSNDSSKKFGKDSSDSFGGLLKSLAPVAGAIGGVWGALKAGKSIMESNQTATAAWEEVLGGVDGAMHTLQTSISNMDFSNFFDNMMNAIKAGEDYKKAIDAINMEKRGAGIVAAKNAPVEAELLTQARIALKAKNTPAADAFFSNYIFLKQQDYAEQVKMAKDERDAEIALAKEKTKGMTAADLEYTMTAIVNNKKLYDDAVKYNELQGNLDAAEIANKGTYVGTTFVPAETTKQINDYKSEIAKISPEVKALGKNILAMRDNLSPEDLNKLGSSIAKVYTVEADGINVVRKAEVKLAAIRNGQTVDLEDGVSATDLLGDSTKKLTGKLDDSTKTVKNNMTAWEQYMAIVHAPSNPNLDITNSDMGAKDIAPMDSKGTNLSDSGAYRLFHSLPAKPPKVIDTTNKKLEKTAGIMADINDLMGGFGEAAAMAFGQASAAAKAFSIGAIIASTALAIMNTWAGYGKAGFIGTPMAIAQSAMLTALGAAQVAKATGAFATGGIVGGNSRSGDQNIIRANTGEMILNQTQQARLFAMANGGGGYGSAEITTRVSGSDLILVLNNTQKRNNNIR